MYTKKVNQGENISDKIDGMMKKRSKDKAAYDEETKLQLEEIKNSDRDTNWYLKEILWELTYMRRRASRP